MKIEPRGKFGGVKVHLDPAEAEVFLAHFQAFSANPASSHPHVQAQLGEDKPITIPILTLKLGKKISTLLKSTPDLMVDKTDDQIKEVLVGEQNKAAAKLAALIEGKDWKGVKG